MKNGDDWESEFYVDDEEIKDGILFELWSVKMGSIFEPYEDLSDWAQKEFKISLSRYLLINNELILDGLIEEINFYTHKITPKGYEFSSNGGYLAIKTKKCHKYFKKQSLTNKNERSKKKSEPGCLFYLIIGLVFLITLVLTITFH